MPRRDLVFASNNYYHVLNRGVARMPIFNTKRDYQRFLDLMDYYRFVNASKSFSNFMLLNKEIREDYWRQLTKDSPTQIEIISFCLMPNHFHILLEQKSESGIPVFMTKVQNGYAKYFNKRNDRVGPLFQSMFKAVRIEAEDQLLHTSRYIHLNPTSSHSVSESSLAMYPWSSLQEYLSGEGELTSTEVLLDLVGGKDKYKMFVYDQIEYQQKLADIKRLTLEE